MTPVEFVGYSNLTTGPTARDRDIRKSRSGTLKIMKRALQKSLPKAWAFPAEPALMPARGFAKVLRTFVAELMPGPAGTAFLSEIQAGMEEVWPARARVLRSISNSRTICMLGQLDSCEVLGRKGTMRCCCMSACRYVALLHQQCIPFNGA